MTRRQNQRARAEIKSINVTTPNPANITRKIRRIRQELQDICDGIDTYLEARASIKPAKDLFS